VAIFDYPKPDFFQPKKTDIFNNLELLLHSNIGDYDNTEVAVLRV